MLRIGWTTWGLLGMAAFFFSGLFLGFARIILNFSTLWLQQRNFLVLPVKDRVEVPQEGVTHNPFLLYTERSVLVRMHQQRASLFILLSNERRRRHQSLLAGAELKLERLQVRQCFS